ncbi:MAG: protein kinase [Planctomycetes bacterium]|nr:protein kinase [Planctomycetota bacterium]
MVTKRFACPGCGRRFEAEPATVQTCPACGKKLRRDPERADFPRNLGKCRLESPLDAGGQGSVYRARHVGLDRPVAVKILKSDHRGDPAFAARFEREARLAGRLNHPNVVRVLDAGREGGYYFLVMELVEGTNLDKLVREEGPLPIDRAIRYVREIGKGVAAAHASGILHRDIKPGNLLLDPVEDRVLLTDFGMAKGTVADERLTVTGTLLGTPTTMAPEICVGRPASHASDQYALAVTLFYLIAGRFPFIDESPLALLQKHIREEPPDLSAIRPDCPGGVAGAIRRAMAKDPGNRFPDVLDFAGALATGDPDTRILAGVSAPRPRGKLAVLLSLAALLAAGGVALALAASRGGKKDRDPAGNGKADGPEEPEDEPEAQPDPGTGEDPGLAGEPGPGPTTEPPADVDFLRSLFNAKEVRVTPEGEVDIFYDFTTEKHLSDFKTVFLLRAERVDGGVRLAGAGFWVAKAEFLDVRITVEIELESRAGSIGLVYYAGKEHYYAGIYEVGRKRAVLRIQDGSKRQYDARVQEGIEPPGRDRCASLVRNGDRLVLELADKHVLAAQDARIPSGAPGLILAAEGVVVRTVRIRGTPHPRWVESRRKE